MTPRQRAFRRPNPSGYIPAAGEEVWLARKGMGVVRARGTVLFAVSPLFVRLRINYGQYSVVESWAIEDVRSLGPKGKEQ